MADVTSYERLRQDNILKNQAMLRALGLDTSTMAVSPRRQNLKKDGQAWQDIERRTSARVATTPRVFYGKRSGRDSPIEPSRKSQRLQTQPRISFHEEEEAEAETKDDQGDQDDVDVSCVGEAGDKVAPRQRSWPSAAQPRMPLSPHSTKLLTADIDMIERDHLGDYITPHGGQVKAAVMRAAVKGRDIEPKFNKYSGIIEWANCIFLCVNINGKESRNVFSEEGRFMSWFAQATQREDSPSLQKLIQSSCPILLFCRPVGHPFLYAGRVRYVKHCPDGQPIHFTLELLNLADIIIGPRGDTIREIIGARGTAV